MKTKRDRLGTTLVSVLAGMILCLPQAASSGYIKDPAFADDGVRLVEIGNFDDRGQAAALQPDGKIVIAGMSENDAVEQVAVLRLTANGALDTSFSTNGWATYGMGAGNSFANDVVVMENGSIIVGGAFERDVGGEKQPAVMQLTSAGIVDIAFGPDGSGITAIGEQEGEVEAMAVDGENRVVVAGTLVRDERSQAFVARILADGSLDGTFGDGGIRMVEGDAETEGTFVVVEENGSIIVGGVSKREEDGETALALRFDASGNIDSQYGKGGLAMVEAEGVETAFTSAVLLQDGSLVGAGYAVTDGRRQIMAARLTSAGVVDTGYGSIGIASIDLEGEAMANDIELRQDGTVVIIGESSGDNGDMILVQLDGRGSQMSETVLQDAPSSESDIDMIAVQDKAATLITDLNGENDSGKSLLVRQGGGIIVAGFASDGVDDDIAVVAFVSDVPPEISGETDITEIPYLIATLDVTGISRNSGMSGGVISENEQFVCDDSSDPDDCRPTVTERGVVYGVVPYPSYQAVDETDDGSGTPADGETSNSVFPDWVGDSSTNYTLVRYGRTSNGSGKGTYGSDITDVTPETTYYVRAYALLSDETVVYGNQETFKTDDACFIATAAYGSPLQSQVRVLRQFRDEYLKTTGAGRTFVGLYYHYSPEAAEFISRSGLLRLAVRIALLPLVAFSYFMVTFSLQVKLLFLFIGGGILLANTFAFSRRHTVNNEPFQS